MTDSLSQLLRNADASAPPPRAMAGIADAVRGRQRKQRRRIRIITTSVVVVLAAICFSVQFRRTPTQVVTRPPAPTVDPRSRLALAQIDLDVQLHELTAKQLLAAIPARRRQAVVPVNVAEERDRAALILIYEGDGYARDQRSADAIAVWRRAIDLFPQSHWAEVARQRLTQFQG